MGCILPTYAFQSRVSNIWAQGQLKIFFGHIKFNHFWRIFEPLLWDQNILQILWNFDLILPASTFQSRVSNIWPQGQLKIIFGRRNSVLLMKIRQLQYQLSIKSWYSMSMWRDVPSTSIYKTLVYIYPTNITSVYTDQFIVFQAQ